MTGTIGNLKYNIRNKIGYRLLVFIVMCSSLITLVLTGVQLYADYNRDVDSIQGRFVAIERGYLSSIRENLWLLDADRLSILLDGIVNLPDMVRAEVRDSEGELLAHSDRGEARRVVETRYDLVYEARNRNINIGSITVVASLDGAVSRVIERAGIILLSNAVKTTVVAFFIYFLVHQMVARHLVRVAQYAREFDINDRQPPLVLERGNRREPDDELSALVAGINQMQEGLARGYDSLQRVNDKLEQRVWDRTKDIEILKDRAENYLNIAGTFITTLDRTGKVTLINRKGTELLGRKADEVVGKDWFEIAIPQDARFSERGLFEHLLVGNTVNSSSHMGEILALDGRVRSIAWSNTLIRDDDNQAVGVLCAGEDVTDREAAAQALEYNQERFRDFAQSGSDWFWETDENHRYTYVSQKGPSTIRRSMAEVLGARRWDFVDRDVTVGADIKWVKHFQDLQSRRPFRDFEYRICIPGGRRQIMRVNGVPVHDPDGEFIGYRGTASDVTTEWRQREIIEALSQRSSAILGAAGEGIVGVDKNGNCTFINPAAAAVIGLSVEGAIGKDLHEIFRHRPIGEAECAGVDCPIQGTLSDGVARSLSGQGLHVSNGDLVAIDFTCSAMTEGDEVVGGVVVFRDVGEQHALQAQLMQVSKLATLGEMATGVAHELNQPLSVIRLEVGNLNRRLNAQPINRDFLERKLSTIGRHVDRAATIIDHMKVFGRIGHLGLTPLYAGEVARSSVELIKKSLENSNIKLNLREMAPGLKFEGNQVQLEQVLLNLVGNARDAIKSTKGPEGGSIEIVVAQNSDLENVTISVRDDAGGIPENILNRIFEPFFTTKEAGEGIGLGLSISYGIVKDMGGVLSACNIEGGAAFVLSLPIFSAAEDTKSAALE